MVEVREARLPMAGPWLRMTYPRYRDALQSAFAADLVTVVVAERDNEPVGMCVAERDGESHSGTVLSLFVSAEFRGEGIGGSLLKASVQALRNGGCAKAEIVFTDEKPDAAARMRAMLSRAGWDAPVKRMLVFRWDLKGYDAELPWMKSFTLRQGFDIGLWSDVTEAEKAQLRDSDQRDGWIAPDLRPWDFEENYEPLNSLSLRYEGELVGWMINDRVAPDVIRFTCSFVREDLQKAGCIIALYARALKLQMEAGILQVMWAVPFQHPRMIAFSKRRLATNSATWFTTYGSSIEL
jgi:GNAT superfamily N-acetyltransferase